MSLLYNMSFARVLENTWLYNAIISSYKTRFNFIRDVDYDNVVIESLMLGYTDPAKPPKIVSIKCKFYVNNKIIATGGLYNNQETITLHRV
jgi:hypothetical protein